MRNNGKGRLLECADSLTLSIGHNSKTPILYIPSSHFDSRILAMLASSTLVCAHQTTKDYLMTQQVQSTHVSTTEQTNNHPD